METELWRGYSGTARRKGRQQTNQTYRHRATSLLYPLLPFPVCGSGRSAILPIAMCRHSNTRFDWGNGVGPNRTQRRLTGLATKDDRAFNPVGFPSTAPFMPAGSIRSKSTSPLSSAKSLPPTTSHRWPPSNNACSPFRPTMKLWLNPSNGNSPVTILPNSSPSSGRSVTRSCAWPHKLRIRVRTYEPRYLAWFFRKVAHR